MPYPEAIRFAALFAFLVIANQANASDSDWKKHLFDFNIPSLNFETDVPADSNVQTVRMDTAGPGTIYETLNESQIEDISAYPVPAWKDTRSPLQRVMFASH